VKEYDQKGRLVYAHAELTMEESQPDWIIDAANARKSKEQVSKLKRGKRNGASATPGRVFP
jgi:hypothetical protein